MDHLTWSSWTYKRMWYLWYGGLRMLLPRIRWNGSVSKKGTSICFLVETLGIKKKHPEVTTKILTVIGSQKPPGCFWRFPMWKRESNPFNYRWIQWFLVLRVQPVVFVVYWRDLENVHLKANALKMRSLAHNWSWKIILCGQANY